MEINENFGKNKVVSAGGVIVEKGKVLLVYFHDHSGVSFPKGHVEEGESYEQAALREVREETGLLDLHIVKKLGVVTRPGTETNGIEVIKDIHLYLIKVTGKSKGKAEEKIVWLPIEEAMTKLLSQEAEFLRLIKPELDCS